MSNYFSIEKMLIVVIFFQENLNFKLISPNLNRYIIDIASNLEHEQNLPSTSCKFRTVGIHDSFPIYKDTTELSELFSCGTVTNLLDDGSRQSQNLTKSTYGARRAAYVCNLLLASSYE